MTLIAHVFYNTGILVISDKIINDFRSINVHYEHILIVRNEDIVAFVTTIQLENENTWTLKI